MFPLPWIHIVNKKTQHDTHSLFTYIIWMQICNEVEIARLHVLHASTKERSAPISAYWRLSFRWRRIENSKPCTRCLGWAMSRKSSQISRKKTGRWRWIHSCGRPYAVTRIRCSAPTETIEEFVRSWGCTEHSISNFPKFQLKG